MPSTLEKMRTNKKDLLTKHFAVFCSASLIAFMLLRFDCSFDAAFIIMCSMYYSFVLLSPSGISIMLHIVRG